MTNLSTEKHRSNWSIPKFLESIVLFKSIGPVSKAGKRTVATTAASVICLMTGQAAFADDAKIKSFSLNTQAIYQFDQINVTSSSGSRWDTIEPGIVKFNMTGRLDTKWPGEVVEAGVFLGDCADQQCANYPLLFNRNFANTRDWNINETISFSTSRIPVGSPNAVMLSDFGQQAVAACNTGSNDGPNVTKSFNLGMTVSLSVNTQKNLTTADFFGPGDWNFNGGDTTQRSNFAVKVNCIPYASMVVGADPVEVKLTVDKPTANACPATGTIKTRMVYHYPKTASFNIKRNGKVIKTVEIKARREVISHGPDQWVIDRHDQVEVEGGENAFRIKVKGGGESNIVRFNHNCPQFEVLFSDLRYDVINIGSCPKKVYETASFITSGPGEATYQLVQESGHVFFEKKIQTVFNNGQYKLLGQRLLEIPQAFEGKFKAQIKGMSGIHTGWELLKVECPSEVGSAGQGAAGGLTVAPKPSHSAEEAPKVLVAPLPIPRKPVVVVAPKSEKPQIKTAPLPVNRDNAAQRAKEREEAKKAEAARKEVKKAEAARKEAKKAEAARKEAKKAEAARKEAKKAEAARKEAKKAEAARKEAKKAEAARKAAKKAEAARKEAKKAEARKAAKKAEAKKNKTSQRANPRKCPKGKELLRGRCIKPAG